MKNKYFFLFYRISKERFIYLAKEIVKVFPSESEAVYFIPSHRDSNGKPISAHGKLWDKYVNTRRKYRELELISNKKRRVENKTEPAEMILTEEIEISINWLKHNVFPWTSVEEKWELTSRYRQQETQNWELQKNFTTFISLQEPLGYSLVSDI